MVWLHEKELMSVIMLVKVHCIFHNHASNINEGEDFRSAENYEL